MNDERKPATSARIHDYFLGGTYNFPADREAAKGMIAMFPDAAMAAKSNRAFLRNAVRYMTHAGVRQFLEIGSGLPTEGHVHETAQEIAPETRVVYVDMDPVAVAESLELLAGNDQATVVRADVRDPQTILNHPRVRALIDFDQPLGLMLVAVMHFVSDEAGAYELTDTLKGALAPGSYVALSHTVCNEELPDHVTLDIEQQIQKIFSQQTTVQLTPRNRTQIERFFDGLELVDPGVVWLAQWQADPKDRAEVTGEEWRTVMKAGVARKP